MQESQQVADRAAEAVRLNNLGVAYMNQQRFEQALAAFDEAGQLDPKLAMPRLNRGIALLNLQQFDAAREALQKAAEEEPKNPRVWYNLGLLEKTTGNASGALEKFQRVVELDPDDADTFYFIGLLNTQLQQYEAAIAALQRALQLNPFHVSAEFGLARAYQRKNNPEQARQHLARFQKLTQEKLGAPMGLAYGDQGKYSLVEQVNLPAGTAPPPIPVKFVPVPASESGLDFVTSAEGDVTSPLGAGACFLDFDSDGRTDVLLLTNARARTSALFHNLGGGRFADVTQRAKLEARGLATACAAGDYDNDGFTDIAVSFETHKVRMYRNQGDGTFLDVTAMTGIDSDAAQPCGLTFVDYDHDGDLDLFVSKPARLWRNNGNGTFTDVSEPTGMGADDYWSAVVADFNNDRAIDFLLAGGADSPSLRLNPREGRFRAAEPWGDQPPARATAAAAFDFDQDGWMDVVFAGWRAPGVSWWRNVRGQRFQRVALPTLEAPAWGVVAFDYDNDGWTDLAVVAEGPERDTLHVYRNRGGEGFEDVTSRVLPDGLKLAGPRALVTADYDGDGDADLVITQSGGPVVLLRNDGGNKNNWIKLSLKGLADNKSAIGTKVEVFSGSLYQKFEVQSSSGYLGQSAPDLLIGLGSAKEADIVRLLWPTGVLQDEIQLAAGKRHEIVEIDRRGSSCPVVFAWNGSRFEFIADMIGPGIVGHWVAPGVRNTPDPTEYLKLRGQQAQPRDGRLHFRFVEPMEEVVYLDQVRLIAVDHPGEIDVYPNERFASVPPFPEFKVIAARAPRSPAGAWDSQGRSVLDELLRRDRRYVTGFADAAFKGFIEWHWVELDLGEVEASRTLRLLMHGFTDYFTATSVYAAHQAGVTPVVPYVEALDASGRWVRVADDIGFPAGLARTMVADLTGKLPPGARRIRIATNLKIYWDQILIDTTSDGQLFHVTEIPLADARLRFLGYPREVRGNPPGDITYAYDEVSPTGPYARQVGNYTRYGDVRVLLGSADDRFVIMGSGDEIALDFDARPLPALPPGWTRDYFFFADGFSKDMDFYAAHADTVVPLPFHAMGRYSYSGAADYPAGDTFLDYQLSFNDRLVSRHSGGGFRFVFSKKRTPAQ